MIGNSCYIATVLSQRIPKFDYLFFNYKNNSYSVQTTYKNKESVDSIHKKHYLKISKMRERLKKHRKERSMVLLQKVKLRRTHAFSVHVPPGVISVGSTQV